MSKMILEGFYDDEEYKLIAIHCANEAYKLAYLLNKNLNLKLQRKEIDLDVKHSTGTAFYQFYSFFNKNSGCEYFLIANKFKSIPEDTINSNSLFPESSTYKTYLLPEYKNVDYFLKIEGNIEEINLKNHLFALNEITNIVTAYAVESDKVKTKENLIFN